MDAAARCTISFKALQRCRTTVEDFVQSYFKYHGLALQDIFKYFDVLLWVEGTLYQLDEENELAASRGDLCEGIHLIGDSGLLQVLRQQGLLDDRIEEELLQVLNMLMYRLTRCPYNEALLAFLRVDEMLVDIGDDLFDYEDDVIANSFNILRAFVHIYGEEAQLKLIQRISDLERQHRIALAGLSVELQQHWSSRHKEAAGGDEGGGGRWSFPPIIYDEGSFRKSASP